MKNKASSVLLLATLFLFGFHSCNLKNSSKNSESDIIDESQVEVSEANPNGDSELAVLMRGLFEEGEIIKNNITSGKGTITQKYINMIEYGHTATPTDPTVKTEEYTKLNNELIQEAKLLLGGEVETKAGFNAVVDKCMACHEVFCTGPMKRIKKLYIK